jgi:recombining binding protein (suppressor of hairless)
MIGNSWWSDVIRHGEEPKLCPPKVVISISGEPTAQDGTVDWTSSSGKSFDVSEPPLGTTYIGRCVGKQLFISDVDEKKKKVEALVKIIAAASDTEPERVIGTFPSRPIKVISKPSKKRQSAKNLERKSRIARGEGMLILTIPSLYQPRLHHFSFPSSSFANSIH